MRKNYQVFLILFVCLATGCRHKTEMETYHLHSPADGCLWCGYDKGLTKQDSIFFNSIVSIYMAVPAYGEKCLDSYEDNTQYRLMYEGSYGLYIVRVSPTEIVIKKTDSIYNKRENNVKNLTPREQKEYRAYQYAFFNKDSTGKTYKDSINYYRQTYPKINDSDYQRYLIEKRYGFVNDTVFYKQITIPISQGEFDRLGAKISSAGFGDMNSYNDHGIEVDGSWWVIEVKEGTKYHYVYYDDFLLNRKFRALCMEFMKYTGADTATIQ